MDYATALFSLILTCAQYWLVLYWIELYYWILQAHIANPNAIILCVQDATRDAEGSGVADVVRNADPKGKRTVRDGCYF